MPTDVPEKLVKIVRDMDECDNVSLTRLTVLKKWFERPVRLRAFGVWIAQQACARKEKSAGAAALIADAWELVGGADELHPRLKRAAAEALLGRLEDFQDEHKNQNWGPVRIVHDWNLLLVEAGLALYLRHDDSPSQGYKLAADFCQHYDPRYGNGLNGPSAARIKEIVGFIMTVERLEEEGA
jgi:hypothetical protein